MWQNFSRRRQEGERFTSYASYREDPLTGQAYTIPINEITLLPYLRMNFARQLNLTQVRSRASSPDEQKAFLKEAVIRWLRSQSQNRDEYGRVPFQEYDRSDSYYSFDPEDLDNIDFTIDEVRTNFHDRSGPPQCRSHLGANTSWQGHPYILFL